jgi:hypothetical protein
MNKPPSWFTVAVVVALVWNLLGLFAVVSDLLLSASDIAALPQEQQAMYAARPAWSVAASVIAVAAGSLGCLGLLVRKRWAHWTLYISLVGVILQDIGIFLMAGSGSRPGIVPLVLQSIVLLVAVALVVLARKATTRSWLA